MQSPEVLVQWLALFFLKWVVLGSFLTIWPAVLSDQLPTQVHLVLLIMGTSCVFKFWNFCLMCFIVFLFIERQKRPAPKGDDTEKKDEEEWQLKDVVFVEDVKSVPAGM
jgi:hypothetical protein